MKYIKQTLANLDRRILEIERRLKIVDDDRSKAIREANVKELDELCELVSKHFDVSANAIRGKTRTHKVFCARATFCRIATEKLERNTFDVGHYLSRDRSSVSYASNEIGSLYGQDSDLLNRYLSTLAEFNKSL